MADNKLFTALRSLLWILIPAAIYLVVGMMIRPSGIDVFWMMAQMVLFVGIPFFIANISLLILLEKKMSMVLSVILAVFIYVVLLLLVAYTSTITLFRSEGFVFATILLFGAIGLILYLINAFFICRKKS